MREQKKAARRPPFSLTLSNFKLLGDDGLYRTCINTGAAVGAQFSIDQVDFSLADSVDGARIDTASTASAFISDNVSQGVHLLLN
jgi:hypothetical protein